MASDIVSGKTAYVNGVKLTGTGSGGGGSTRQVIGTFTSTSSDKGKAIEVDVPYTGSGYPISILVFPSAGGRQGDAWTRIQRYAALMYSAAKGALTGSDAVPDFTGSSAKNNGICNTVYKNSTTSATTYAWNGSTNFQFLVSTAPGETIGSILRMPSSKKIKLTIANTSYGFMDSIEYTYVITYSE